MIAPLLVGAGGIAGAICRHLVGERVDELPVDTLAVNVLGSLALGFLLGVGPGEDVLAVFGTGFCGAFTTFSTFAIETVRLAETGNRSGAARNALVTLFGALLAVWVGLWLGGLAT